MSSSPASSPSYTCSSASMAAFFCKIAAANLASSTSASSFWTAWGSSSSICTCSTSAPPAGNQHALERAPSTASKHTGHTHAPNNGASLPRRLPSAEPCSPFAALAATALPPAALPTPLPIALPAGATTLPSAATAGPDFASLASSCLASPSTPFASASTAASISRAFVSASCFFFRRALFFSRSRFLRRRLRFSFSASDRGLPSLSVSFSLCRRRRRSLLLDRFRLVCSPPASAAPAPDSAASTVPGNGRAPLPCCFVSSAWSPSMTRLRAVFPPPPPASSISCAPAQTCGA